MSSKSEPESTADELERLRGIERRLKERLRRIKRLSQLGGICGLVPQATFQQEITEFERILNG